jgi:hypothetical protein
VVVVEQLVDLSRLLLVADCIIYLLQLSLLPLPQAQKMYRDLEARFEKAKSKFSGDKGVLAYFGEDPGMSSTDFFTTLHKFVQVSS